MLSSGEQWEDTLTTSEGDVIPLPKVVKLIEEEEKSKEIVEYTKDVIRGLSSMDPRIHISRKPKVLLIGKRTTRSSKPKTFSFDEIRKEYKMTPISGKSGRGERSKQVFEVLFSSNTPITVREMAISTGCSRGSARNILTRLSDKELGLAQRMGTEPESYLATKILTFEESLKMIDIQGSRNPSEKKACEVIKPPKGDRYLEDRILKWWASGKIPTEKEIEIMAKNIMRDRLGREGV